MTAADRRVWRRTDGTLTVEESDPEAAFLVYAVGDELTAADDAALKMRAPAQNKAVRPETKKT